MRARRRFSIIGLLLCNERDDLLVIVRAIQREFFSSKINKNSFVVCRRHLMTPSASAEVSHDSQQKIATPYPQEDPINSALSSHKREKEFHDRKKSYRLRRGFLLLFSRRHEKFELSRKRFSRVVKMKLMKSFKIHH